MFDSSTIRTDLQWYTRWNKLFFVVNYDGNDTIISMSYRFISGLSCDTLTVTYEDGSVEKWPSRRKLLVRPYCSNPIYPNSLGKSRQGTSQSADKAKSFFARQFLNKKK